VGRPRISIQHALDHGTTPRHSLYPTNRRRPESVNQPGRRYLTDGPAPLRAPNAARGSKRSAMN